MHAMDAYNKIRGKKSFFIFIFFIRPPESISQLEIRNLDIGKSLSTSNMKKQRGWISTKQSCNDQ